MITLSSLSGHGRTSIKTIFLLFYLVAALIPFTLPSPSESSETPTLIARAEYSLSGEWKVMRKNDYWKWDWEEDYWVISIESGKGTILDVDKSYRCYGTANRTSLECKWESDIAESITKISLSADGQRFNGQIHFRYHAGGEGVEHLKGIRIARQSDIETEKNKKRCEQYAKTAVDQNKKNQWTNCGYTGNRWSNNYAGHFNWCLSVSKSDANNETKTRTEQLQQCLSKLGIKKPISTPEERPKDAQWFGTALVLRGSIEITWMDENSGKEKRKTLKVGENFFFAPESPAIKGEFYVKPSEDSYTKIDWEDGVVSVLRGPFNFVIPTHTRIGNQGKPVMRFFPKVNSHAHFKKWKKSKGKDIGVTAKTIRHEYYPYRGGSGVPIWGSSERKRPQTANAITSIAGTEWHVSVVEDQVLIFHVIEGEVEIWDGKKRKTVIAHSGQVVTVIPGDIPSNPKPFDVNALDPWWRKEPISASVRKPDVTHPRFGTNGIRNGGFVHGTGGWKIGQYGYQGSPRPHGVIQPEIGAGCLRLGVFGGTQYAVQTVNIPNADLTVKARFKVEQWSTYQNGRPGGWAAVGVSFLNQNHQSLATTFYYITPHSTFNDKPGVKWVKLGSGTPTPTGWLNVDSSLSREILNHGLNTKQVTQIKIGAYVFGTHEDKTKTVACFDDFSLTGSTQPPRRRTVKNADGWLGVWNVKTYVKECPSSAPDGSWPGIFKVFKDSAGYHFKWLHTDVDVDLL